MRLGNRIEMTNRKVIIDADLLGRKFELANSQVLNDWEAVGYAIDEMKLKKIKKGKSKSNVDLMIGPGDRSGICYCCRWKSHTNRNWKYKTS